MTKRAMAKGGIPMAALAALLAAWDAAAAGDWPRFRGPNGNSIVEDKAFDPAALAAGKKIWTAEVGKGYSAISVADGRAITMGNDGGRDTVFCFDAASGKELWRHSYPSEPGNYPGPRASPWIENDRVYTVGYWGIVCCLETATGKVIWQKDVVSDTGAQVPQWGQAGSPIVVGDLLVLNIGESGCALRKATGAVFWSSKPQPSGYATVMPVEVRGKPRLVVFGAKALYLVETATGGIAVRHPWETSYDVNAADPVPAGKDRVFLSSGYDSGCALLDLGGAAPKVVWRNRSIRNHFSSSILFDGSLYGCDGNAGSGDLTCLDPLTGKEKWRHKLGFGSLIVVNGHIVFFNEKGDVIAGKPSAGGFQEAGRANRVVTGGKAWTAPVCAEGRLFLRNDQGSIACLSAGK